MLQNNVILGAGIAGISAGYHLRKKGVDAIIYEKDNDWGGLCNNFTIDGFRFDRFVHFSFAPDKYTDDLFEQSSPLHAHHPVSYNYYKGYWIKHPAQNNLFPLSTSKKVKVIKDFINRERKELSEITNYDEWLRVQYGNYFAENFPLAYTRKYWGKEAIELETKWVGVRMHTPALEEVLSGAFEELSRNFYYTNFMKYPRRGGFRSILNKVRNQVHIEFKKEAVRIGNQKIVFSDGRCATYSRLISSLPLPEIIPMLVNVPTEVLLAVSKLKWTCGYQVSLGFNKRDIAKHLWFYIYDEDILPARIYSPSLKSSDNVPEGMSSLQAEIFFANDVIIPSAEEVLEKTIAKLLEIKLFNKEDIIVQDIRFEKYANIIFTPEIYKNRQLIRDYLASLGIETIGRFGKWDYLWTHQAFETGRGL